MKHSVPGCSMLPITYLPNTRRGSQIGIRERISYTARSANQLFGNFSRERRYGKNLQGSERSVSRCVRTSSVDFTRTFPVRVTFLRSPLFSQDIAISGTAELTIEPERSFSARLCTFARAYAASHVVPFDPRCNY